LGASNFAGGDAGIWVSEVVSNPNRDVSMSKTVTIEIPAESETLVRQLLALHEELQTLAFSAADGTVLDACETAVLPKGRELTKNLLADAVTRRIQAAEKKGRRSAPATADEPRKIVVKNPGSS
jgi:hypothetical protein